MSDEDFVAAFTTVRRWRDKAPHKLLLLLLAIGRMRRGEPRLMRFEDVEADLVRVLGELGSGTSIHPEYPFWRLQNDGVWEVPEAESMAVNSGGDVTARALRDAGARGGLPEAAFARLLAQPELQQQVAAALAATAFPALERAVVLRACRLADPLEKKIDSEHRPIAKSRR